MSESWQALAETAATAPLWLWLWLGALLVLSGTCSASETALFSLEDRERPQAGAAVDRLLSYPRDLLVSVLLANLVVNILYFAFADRLRPPAVGFARELHLLISLVALLIAGEILPKTLGLRARLSFSRAVGPLWLGVVRLLGPLRRAIVSLLDLISRLGQSTRDERELSARELSALIESSAEEGVLKSDEVDLLTEIVELREIRVREIMTPRVDNLFCELDGSNREEVLAQAVEQRLSWLPVIEGAADAVRGRLRVRDLLVHCDRPIAQLVMPVKFVPEVASALDLLRQLREDRAKEAVCVDEWGGTAGTVTIEDVVEEIVGDLRAEGEQPDNLIERLSEGEYKVSGALSVRDWNERFGSEVVPSEFETVGGLVTALLGHIPKPGDEVEYGPLRMQVASVDGRRVEFVRLSVPQAAGRLG